MRGLAHIHPIESAIVRHEEGNEGEKIGVKRRFAAFYGAKLLKIMGSKIQRNHRVTSAPSLSHPDRPRGKPPRQPDLSVFLLLLGTAGFEERIGICLCV